ncbi:MAG: hypothetical protein OXI96_05300 [Acidimicrobiaceae bacterium]|nr:hypothetical protein [Acidimicrobiaceae bacterium]
MLNPVWDQPLTTTLNLVLNEILSTNNRLGEASEAVFEEIDLQEEWIAAAIDRGGDHTEAERAFHEWIRSRDNSKKSYQKMLREPQRRAGVRKEMRRHLARRPAARPPHANGLQPSHAL